MYSVQPGMILAFHGCDQKLGEQVLADQDSLKRSENDYDWLGHGIYFWENDPKRALRWAQQLCDHGKLDCPFALGAVIDPGYCLDLMQAESLSLLHETYIELKTLLSSSGKPLPVNRPLKGSDDLLLRFLDCAVIETLHYSRKLAGEKPFDSIRGVFWEGKELYPNAGFKQQNHIQVCVRNPNCIIGYFRVRQRDLSFNIP